MYLALRLFLKSLPRDVPNVKKEFAASGVQPTSQLIAFHSSVWPADFLTDGTASGPHSSASLVRIRTAGVAKKLQV